jgi:sulfite exporter TauE/SafE
MTEYFVAFITGLTTGGLSCLAVQGGLLASSLASQIETDMKNRKNKSQPKVAQPIIWFLLSKLIAYTILGFFLGWLGSVLQLNPVSRAILQIAIGIFMVGQAMRLFNVHPIFRYFNIEPPKFITRYIRQKSKSGSQIVTPLFMGALTVLIPCGITQVMMASAIATGNPLAGAALMFSFILGTSPVFFVVAYFATRLGERMEKYFMKFVAVVILILGLIGINSGLNLIGSPLSINNLIRLAAGNSTVQASANSITDPGGSGQIPSGTGSNTGACKMAANPNANPSTGACGLTGNGSSFGANPLLPGEATKIPPSEQPTLPAPLATGTQEITINVQNSGYSPQVSHAKAGVPVKLTLISKDVFSCSLAFVIPSLNEQVLLKPNGTYSIDIPAQPANSEMPFSCSMGMYTGVIIFDQ